MRRLFDLSEGLPFQPRATFLFSYRRQPFQVCFLFKSNIESGFISEAKKREQELPIGLLFIFFNREEYFSFALRAPLSPNFFILKLFLRWSAVLDWQIPDQTFYELEEDWRLLPSDKKKYCLLWFWKLLVGVWLGLKNLDWQRWLIWRE